ncbi:membrane integrity-associated transporter subunit PqiC [Pseudoruegeria sp. HB172150]|uniref:PqiC family protein n=1 Tax=Pseudoruegeria sp. HB172150 TaxID=2721164 RepID=UPI001C12EFA5|nr:ABC-type transport auxiliary lipoprotein family protein [Pseudoruegeria sp. HB172150]
MFVLLFVAGCGGEVESRYGEPVRPGSASAPGERVYTAYHSIEVVAVTMPSYAANEEIYVKSTSGAISPLGPLWTDLPERAVTLQLARDLRTVTGALAAPEPWPFVEPADARVDVRIEEFLAVPTGSFRMSGQFFVAPEVEGRNRSGQFSIDAPLTGDGGPAEIARARSRAVSKLAVEIARNGLR